MSNEQTPQAENIVLGNGEPSIDYNGTRYTSVEGRARNNHISLRDRHFDGLRHPGIALTNTQAALLGVRVGDRVIVHDNRTNRDVEARYHDNAGRPGNTRHFEVNPALADALGLHYRRHGVVVDGIARSETMRNRFEIRKMPAR